MLGILVLRARRGIQYFERTYEESGPQTKLSNASNDVDVTLREAEVVLERVGEEAEGVAAKTIMGTWGA